MAAIDSLNIVRLRLGEGGDRDRQNKEQQQGDSKHDFPSFLKANLLVVERGLSLQWTPERSEALTVGGLQNTHHTHVAKAEEK